MGKSNVGIIARKASLVACGRIFPFLVLAPKLSTVQPFAGAKRGPNTSILRPRITDQAQLPGTHTHTHAFTPLPYTRSASTDLKTTRVLAVLNVWGAGAGTGADSVVVEGGQQELGFFQAPVVSATTTGCGARWRLLHLLPPPPPPPWPVEWHAGEGCGSLASCLSRSP